MKTNPAAIKAFLVAAGLSAVTAAAVETWPDGIEAMNQDGDYPLSVEPGDTGGRKLLFLGNSITLHSPKPEIGWTNRCGMAASSREKDYVHRVAAAFAAEDGRAPHLYIRNIADFETGGYKNNYAAGLTNEVAFAPDFVVIAVGENVSGFADAADQEAYCAALAAMGGLFQDAETVVLRSPFWQSDTKAALTQAAATRIGATYVDGGAIGADHDNWAVGQFEHSGVAAHPGDEGMRKLADQLVSAFGIRQLVAESSPVSFDIDANCGAPFAVHDLNPRHITFREGETVTETSPDGATRTLLSSAGYDGAFNWAPTAGGSWTLENSVSGTAVFGVRYSLFGVQDSGTMANPFRLTDADELTDLVEAGTARAGTVFVLCDSVSIDELVLPAGYSLTALGGDIYRLTSLSGGMLHASAAAAFRLDTERPGPDRRARTTDEVRIAYTADDWKGGAGTSAVTLMAPSGATTSHASLSGSGALAPVRLREAGDWTATLTMGSGTQLSGVVTVLEDGSFISIR